MKSVSNIVAGKNISKTRFHLFFQKRKKLNNTIATSSPQAQNKKETICCRFLPSSTQLSFSSSFNCAGSMPCSFHFIYIFPKKKLKTAFGDVFARSNNLFRVFTNHKISREK